ncbi:MAG TPA: M23 family metallopeptidase [Clostridia bacterium]|nr:M23 family metallopeptidase [Clostridia bacterium]
MSNFKVGNSRFSRFMNGKGFYIALALCLVAVGSAAYIAANKSLGISQSPQTSSNSAVSNYTPSQDSSLTSSSTQQTGNNVSGVPDDSSSSSTASAATGTSSSSSTGSSAKSAAPTFYVLPVQGSVITKYSPDTPLYDKTMDDWRVHDGVDIASDQGTPVKACADGTVTAVTKDAILGQVVEITHGGGLKSLYANLSTNVTVKKAQKVEAGQVIGCVGQTAQGEISLVPHLHFAMTKNGNYVDPLITIGKK